MIYCIRKITHPKDKLQSFHTVSCYKGSARAYCNHLEARGIKHLMAYHIRGGQKWHVDRGLEPPVKLNKDGVSVYDLLQGLDEEAVFVKAADGRWILVDSVGYPKGSFGDAYLCRVANVMLEELRKVYDREPNDYVVKVCSNTDELAACAPKYGIPIETDTKGLKDVPPDNRMALSSEVDIQNKYDISLMSRFDRVTLADKLETLVNKAQRHNEALKACKCIGSYFRCVIDDTEEGLITSISDDFTSIQRQTTECLYSLRELEGYLGIELHYWAHANPSYWGNTTGWRVWKNQNVWRASDKDIKHSIKRGWTPHPKWECSHNLIQSKLRTVAGRLKGCLPLEDDFMPEVKGLVI